MAICQECKKRPATIHYTEIVNDQMVTLNLCVECAADKGVSVEKSGSYGLGDLVAGLIDDGATSEAERIGKVRCPRCGYDYSEFKKIGRLGCPECYEAFETQLLPVLRHVHGSTHHTGKVPPAVRSRTEARQRASSLREELSRAIEAEEYERAAAIRDEIRDLETSGGDKS
jgi:protein arginine kinase activator